MRLQTPAAHHLHDIAEINRSSGRKVFPRGHWDNKVCGKEVRRGGDEQIRPFYMPAKLVNNFSAPDAILPLTYSVYFCPIFLMLQAKCWWHGKEQKLTIQILQILLVTLERNLLQHLTVKRLLWQAAVASFHVFLKGYWVEISQDILLCSNRDDVQNTSFWLCNLSQSEISQHVSLRRTTWSFLSLSTEEIIL